MGTVRVLISKELIDQRVAQLASVIDADYEGKNPVLVGVLKGSFVFLADLVRKLKIPVEVDFVRVSSYGARKQSSGKPKLVHGPGLPIKGRHVILVEDIVDTGVTIRFLLDYFARRKPVSLKLCTLFDKPSRRRVEVPIDYVGFTLPDAFAVGCGLDYDEQYRYLPDLCILEEP
jgi:hypoxanthine phosphoribosyltransferase